MRTVTVREYDRGRGVPVSGLWRRDVDSRDLLALRKAGMQVKDIAKRFGIAKSTVCERLKRHFPEEYRGLRVNQTRVKYYAQCARAYRLYQELGSYNKVARAVGCVHSAAIGRVKFMKGVLREAGEGSCGDEYEVEDLVDGMEEGLC